MVTHSDMLNSERCVGSVLWRWRWRSGMTAWRGHRGLDTTNTKLPSERNMCHVRLNCTRIRHMCIVCALAQDIHAHAYSYHQLAQVNEYPDAIVV